MSDFNPERPAQAGDLEVSEVDDGLVIYHSRPERVHVLNRTAAFVFLLCQGDRTADDIAEEVRIAFGLREAPEDLVAQCIAELRVQNLLR